MGTGRKKGPGGGGTSLNFKVVGNPQPANPKENTIWLNTDVDITGQYLQAEQPEGMAEGEVWISTGKESQVAFNVLKKGTIMVYPLAAKQMQGGTLVDVTAKSWQGGEWVDWWNGQLYENGNEFEGVTGGWISEAVGIPGAVGTETSIVRHDDYMEIRQPNGNGICRTNNKIDLSENDRLIFEGDIIGYGTHMYYYIKVWSEIGSSATDNVVAFAEIHNINANDAKVTIDVSGLTGSYYIGFSLCTDTVSINMKKFYME